MLMFVEKCLVRVVGICFFFLNDNVIIGSQSWIRSSSRRSRVLYLVERYRSLLFVGFTIVFKTVSKQQSNKQHLQNNNRNINRELTVQSAMSTGKLKALGYPLAAVFDANGKHNLLIQSIFQKRNSGDPSLNIGDYLFSALAIFC